MNHEDYTFGAVLHKRKTTGAISIVTIQQRALYLGIHIGKKNKGEGEKKSRVIRTRASVFSQRWLFVTVRPDDGWYAINGLKIGIFRVSLL